MSSTGETPLKILLLSSFKVTHVLHDSVTALLIHEVDNIMIPPFSERKLGLEGREI